MAIDTDFNQRNASDDASLFETTTSYHERTLTLPECSSLLLKFERTLFIPDKISDEATVENANPDLEMGGHYAPKKCRRLHNVAIVIPVRDREEHLRVLLHILHPILQRQLLDYTIIVVEQEAGAPFNRAMMLNVGFVEGIKIRDFHCFIFHDVDHVPLDGRISYSCPTVPTHMSAGVDKWKFNVPYYDMYGGVSSMKTEDFRKVNGFSNKFFGWGGEDDNLFNRIMNVGLMVSRYHKVIARYKMLRHKKNSEKAKDRIRLLDAKKNDFHNDGLSSLKYKLLRKESKKLYTRFVVSVNVNVNEIKGKNS